MIEVKIRIQNLNSKINQTHHIVFTPRMANVRIVYEIDTIFKTNIHLIKIYHSYFKI